MKDTYRYERYIYLWKIHIYMKDTYRYESLNTLSLLSLSRLSTLSNFSLSLLSLSRVFLLGIFMVWLRLVGSIKLYVSFAKEPYKRDYILLWVFHTQKKPQDHTWKTLKTPFIFERTSLLGIFLRSLLWGGFG